MRLVIFRLIFYHFSSVYLIVTAEEEKSKSEKSGEASRFFISKEKLTWPAAKKVTFFFAQ